nr:golgin subfamily A member 8C-like isoform X2 [Macaca nemestrina]
MLRSCPQVPFFKSAGASAQEEQARLSEQVKEQRVCCQHLAHPVVLAQKESEAAVPAPGTGGESGSGETPWTLQEVMEKLSYTRTHFRLPRDLKVPPEGRSLSRCDPIILAPERAYGPPGGEGGPEGAGGETRTLIHPVLEREMPSERSSLCNRARGQCQRCGNGRRTSSGWPRTGRR